MAIQAGWKWLKSRANRQLTAILLGGLLLRGAIAYWLPPGFDEAYYYLYTRHLSWSYFDHPLMVSFTTGIGPWLTGQVSQFTIRLGPVLLYTASLWLLYRTSRQLFSQQAGLLTVAIASLIPIFFIGFGVLTLPDSPLIFFWSASLWVSSLEFFPGKNVIYQPTARLALIGLLVGLACLSKYHGAILGAGLVGFCLLSPPQRVALRSPWMLAAVGLFLLAISPILIWNSQHDWVSLRYQSSRAVPGGGYRLLELLGVFGAGVAYLFPSFGLPIWWVSLKTLKQRLTDLGQGNHLQAFSSQTSLILWVSLPLMLGFTLLGGYRPVLPTWPAPGFWGATILLGTAVAKRQPQSPRLIRRWLWGSGLVILTLLLIALLHLRVGLFQYPGRYSLFGGGIPVSTDASTQLIDIQQLRQGLAASAPVQSALQQAAFVFTNELFLAGQVGMAIAPLTDLPITTLDQDLRGFGFWSTADQWVGQNGLYIFSQARLGDRQPLQPYSEYFQTLEPVAALPLYRGGVAIDEIQVYLAKNLLKPFPRPYGH